MRRGAGRTPAARVIAALIAAALAGGCLAAGSPRTDAARFPPAGSGGHVLSRTTELPPTDYYRDLGASAVRFLAYDLEKVHRGDYADRAGGMEAMTADDHVFATPLGAYGFFTALRRRAEAAGIVADLPCAFRARGEHVLHRGRHVVRVSAADPDALPAAVIADLATAVAGGLPPAPCPLKEIAALMAIGLPAEAVVYEPSIILDSPLLAPGLQAEAVLPSGGRFLAFIAVKPSPRSAQEAFDRYLLAGSAGPRGVSFTLGIGDAACALWDERRGWLNLARKGPYLIGLSGLDQPVAGWLPVNRMLTSLGE